MAEEPWITKDRPGEELDISGSAFRRMPVPESHPPPRAMGGVEGAPRQKTGAAAQQEGEFLLPD